MVGVAFSLFVMTSSELYGRSYTIDVITEIITERIFMRICLEFGFLLIEVMVNIPYYLQLVRQR